MSTQDLVGSRRRLPKFLQETFPLLHLPLKVVLAFAKRSPGPMKRGSIDLTVRSPESKIGL
jgi:hypothetical protein